MGGGTLVAKSGTGSGDIDDCDPVGMDGVSVCVWACVSGHLGVETTVLFCLLVILELVC